MFIYKSSFTATSKKSGQPFWNVTLFEKRTTQDKNEYFKEVSIFVSEEVYNGIQKAGYKFGDIVEVIKGEPEYFGGPEQLIGLNLVEESPYFAKN